MLRNAILISILMMFTIVSWGQQLWYENFSGLIDGATVDNGATAWSRSYSGSGSVEKESFFGSNFFQFSNTFTEGEWISESIDISGYGYAVIDMDVTTLGTESGDYLQCYYTIDSDPTEHLFFEIQGEDISFDNLGSAVINGNSITIIVKARNDGGDFYTIDNIEVTGIETLYSRTNGNWTNNSTWSITGHTGSSCSCTPNNETRIEIGNNHTINVNGTGNVTETIIRNGSTLRWTGNNTLNIRGDIFVESGGTLTRNGNNSAEISFDYNIPYSIQNNGSFEIGLLDINSNSFITFFGSGNVTISGNIDITGSSFFGIETNYNPTITNDLSGNLSIGGSLNYGNYSETSEIINNGNMSISTNISMNDQSITIENNGTLSIGTGISINDNADDNCEVVNNGTLNLSTINMGGSDFLFENYGTINMTGNFSNFDGNESLDNLDGSTWNYSGTTTGTGNLALDLNNGSNLFNYDRSGDQPIISPIDSYSNLEVSNGGNKNMSDDVDISGNLILTAGIINTNGNLLTFLSNSSSVSGGSNSSYVDGQVAKLGNSDFDFPTGNGGVWARIGISNLNGANASTEFTAQYTLGDPGLSNTGTLNNVSILEGWTLNHTGGSVSNAMVTLYFEDAGRSEIDNLGDLVVARHNGTQWIDEGQGGGTTANSVTSDAISTFSPFTFGSNSASFNPLPVNLLSFDLISEGNNVIVSWITTSELNNDYFTIERSENGKPFQSIATVKGVGNSKSNSSYSYTDKHLPNGQYYYRLKQTDFDGTEETFKAKYIKIDGNQSTSGLVIYPNPVSHQKLLSLKFKELNIQDDEDIKIIIYNSQGSLTLEESFNSSKILNNTINIGLNNLKPGVYLISANSNQFSFRKKVIIE